MKCSFLIRCWKPFAGFADGLKLTDITRCWFPSLSQAFTAAAFSSCVFVGLFDQSLVSNNWNAQLGEGQVTDLATDKDVMKKFPTPVHEIAFESTVQLLFL